MPATKGAVGNRDVRSWFPGAFGFDRNVIVANADIAIFNCDMCISGRINAVGIRRGRRRADRHMIDSYRSGVFQKQMPTRVNPVRR